jgi:uncharacterized membrane protein YedE/YeeE
MENGRASAARHAAKMLGVLFCVIVVVLECLLFVIPYIMGEEVNVFFVAVLIPGGCIVGFGTTLAGGLFSEWLKSRGRRKPEIVHNISVTNSRQR